MRKLFFISIALMFLISCGSKQDKFNAELEKEKIHVVLTEFFNALSGRDWDNLKSLTTKDMILIEHGLLWNNDSLINAMDKYWSGYDVKYSFDFIKTHVDRNSAWTVYRNHGIAKNQDREIHLHWIETVIFTKEDGRWIIVEAQSTREKDPEIIEKRDE